MEAVNSRVYEISYRVNLDELPLSNLAELIHMWMDVETREIALYHAPWLEEVVDFHAIFAERRIGPAASLDEWRDWLVGENYV